MKFLKRVLYGVIVGTCIMMINQKCVKAYSLTARETSPYFYNVGTRDEDSFFYSLLNDHFDRPCLSGDTNCIQYENVGYIIEPQISFNEQQWKLNGWTTLLSKSNYFDYFDYVIASSESNSSIKAFGTLFQNVPNNAEQTSTFMRVDTQNLPININKWGIFCGSDATFGSCIAFFSEGELPSLYLSSGTSASFTNMNINILSNTTIVYFGRNVKTQYLPTNYYYTFYQATLGETITGYNIGNPFYQYYNNGDSNYIQYISNDDFIVNIDKNYVLPSNAPLEEAFDIDYTEITSTDNSNEIYGNDKTVTSTNIGARFIPYDSVKYDYYLNFTSDSSCSNNIADYNKMEDSEEGIMVLANITENGLVCGVITKKDNNNIIFSKSYIVDDIGKISVFGFSNNKIDIFLNNLINRLNYGGPISSLISIPISLLRALLNTFQSSCMSYNMGAVMGHNIIFDCFKLSDILGNSITSVIDMLASFTIYYHLILFIISIYRKVMQLDDLDDYIPQHLYRPRHGSYDDYNG